MVRDWIMTVAVPLVAVLCGPSALWAEDKVVFALVKAKVVSVGAKKSIMPATLEVVHVYKGPRELKGQTFADEYREHDRRGTAADTPFEVGEEGLWQLNQLLKPGGETQPWVAVGRNRKSENPKYADYEAIAEATERADGAKPGERLPMFQELIADKRPIVARWAVREVGKLTTAEAGEYLKTVAAAPDPKWPFDVQVAFDEVLSRREGVDWQGSKLRDALLRGWVKNAQSEEAAGGVLSRIDRAHQGRELGDKLAVELLTIAAANKEWPVKSRRYTLEQLWRTAKHSANDDARTAAWECVFGHMQKNDELYLRQSAAEAIALFPLPPARVKAVEEHLATEKDEKVAATLRAAVKKAKEMK